MGKHTHGQISKAAASPVTIFHFGELAIRVTQDEHGEPWFIAQDVANALGLKNSRSATYSLEAHEKGVHVVDTLGGKQRVTTISESGLYLLTMRSDKEVAKRFSRLVRGEILPTIRKTGQYIANSKPNQPLAHTKSAQSAIKQIAPPAFNPASLIGQGLPPVPAGLEFPPELAAQIEAAAIAQAMQCIPALRAYLQRRLAYTARNAKGWIPEQIAPSLAAASLQDALNFEAQRDLRACINTAAALQLISTQTLERMRESQAGERGAA